MTTIITRLDNETQKRGRITKLIFDCDRGEKYKKVDGATQSATKKCGCSNVYLSRRRVDPNVMRHIFLRLKCM